MTLARGTQMYTRSPRPSLRPHRQNGGPHRAASEAVVYTVVYKCISSINCLGLQSPVSVYGRLQVLFYGASWNVYMSTCVIHKQKPGPSRSRCFYKWPLINNRCSHQELSPHTQTVRLDREGPGFYSGIPHMLTFKIKDLSCK